MNTMTLDPTGDNELTNGLISKEAGDKITFQDVKATIIANNQGVLQLKVNEVTYKEKPKAPDVPEKDDSPVGVILLTKNEEDE